MKAISSDRSASYGFGDLVQASDWDSGGYDLGTPHPGLTWDPHADGANSGAWRFWNSAHRPSAPHWWDRRYSIPGASLSKWVVRLELEGEWRATGDVNAEAYGASLRVIVDRQQSPTELDSIGVVASGGDLAPGYITWPRGDTGGWKPFQIARDVQAAYPYAATTIRVRLQGRYPPGGSQVWYVRRVNVRAVFSDGTEFNTLTPGLSAPPPGFDLNPPTGNQQGSGEHPMSWTEKSLNEFLVVSTTVRIPSVNHRDPPSVKIKPSGLVSCNTAASECIILASEHRFKELHEAGIQWMVNLAKKEIAARLVAIDSLGATQIRKLADGNFNLYMHNAFLKHPSLRPSGTLSVPVTKHMDADGPFIVFHLNMGAIPGRANRKAVPASNPAIAQPAAGILEVPADEDAKD